jgi:hypothetical protein
MRPSYTKVVNQLANPGKITTKTITINIMIQYGIDPEKI